MSESGNNNLDIFRQSVKRFIHANSQQKNQQSQNLHISSYQQFKQLANYLCNQKLLHPSQVKKLVTKIQPSNNISKSTKNLINSSSFKHSSSEINKQEQQSSQNHTKKKLVSFPLSLKQFQNLIMVEFGDQDCKNLITDMKKFQTLLKQIKGTLNVWKDKGLTNQEKQFFVISNIIRFELQSIFAKGNQKIIKLCDDLKKKKQLLQSISEQQIQMIKSLDEWVEMQKVRKDFQDYKDFNKKNKSTINSLFQKNQVKQAHFKKKDILTKTIQDTFTTKGFNSRNDEPIQVVLISKTSINFQKINQELIKFDALKELSLSQHFPKFFGFNTHSSSTSIQYYVETFQSKNLKSLMKTQKALDTSSPLLKYWMYQIYKALYDIFLMCSYEPQLPIKLEDFQVKEFGLQILLKNIKFIEKRKNFKTNKKIIDPLQTNLLNNLGYILLQLLGINPTLAEIDKNLSKLQQKCFFKSLLNVKQGHRNFQQSIVQNYLTFFNLQTHPLLEESQFSDGTQIIENYIAVFGTQ